MGLGIVYFILLGVNYAISFVEIHVTEPFTGFVIAIVLPVFFIWLTIDPIEFIKKEEKKRRERKKKLVNSP